MARVALLGNHSVPYSSESNYAASFEALGHTVLRLQEGTIRATDVARIVKDFNADLFFHVQTRGLAITGGTDDERAQMLADIKSLGIPTAGYHLDLFFGLDRAEYVRTDPYFKVDYFWSTDGGHDQEWKDAGVNHIYMPPGVFHAEAYDGTPRLNFSSDIAFCGSWKSYAHEEHSLVRMSMLRHLDKKYGRRFRKWPQREAVRGTDLTDLYASVKVVVGDSCLAGKVPMYVSDRCPETMGRGGFLIHPHVPGILNIYPNLVTFPPGDWNTMLEKVDYYLTHDAERESLRKENAEWVRSHHTYKHRMQEILEVVGLA